MKNSILMILIYLYLIISIPERSVAADLDKPIVAGSTVRFEIPARPVGTQEAHEKTSSIVTSDAADALRKQSFAKCPKVSDFIFKIFQRLVESNHLENFGKVSMPGLTLDIMCHYVSAKTGRGGAYANSYGIHVPAYVAEVMKTEHEVAFVIAHELAHILLGHNELIFDLGKFDRAQDPTIIRLETPMAALERDADTYGAIIALNAGYNPLALKGSACREHKLLHQTPAVIPCWAINKEESSSHGSINDRVKFIEEFLLLRHIKYTESNIGFFLDEHDLARNEVRTIKNK